MDTVTERAAAPDANHRRIPAIGYAALAALLLLLTAPATANAYVLISPPNGYKTASLYPQFHWATTADDEQCRIIYISDSAKTDSYGRISTVNLGVTYTDSFDPPFEFMAGTWYWQIECYGTIHQYWSPPRKIVITGWVRRVGATLRTSGIGCRKCIRIKPSFYSNSKRNTVVTAVFWKGRLVARNKVYYEQETPEPGQSKLEPYVIRVPKRIARRKRVKVVIQVTGSKGGRSTTVRHIRIR